MVYSLEPFREEWKENKIMREAASVYERRAKESLQRITEGYKGLDPFKGYTVIEGVAKALELVEMAIGGGAKA